MLAHQRSTLFGFDLPPLRRDVTLESPPIASRTSCCDQTVNAPVPAVGGRLRVAEHQFKVLTVAAAVPLIMANPDRITRRRDLFVFADN